MIESSVAPNGPVDFDWDNLWTDNLDGNPRFVKWIDVKYADLAELVASGAIEAHGFQVEPKYENAAAGDFTLLEGNALLDVGEVIDGINDRFIVGKGPDIGAFERGGENPLPDGGVPDGGPGSDAGAGGEGGFGGASGTVPGGAESCGCRVGDAPESAAFFGTWAFVLGLLFRRHRRTCVTHRS